MKKKMTLSLVLFFVLSIFSVAFAKKSAECKACRKDLKACVTNAKKKKGKKAKRAAVKACFATAKSCRTTCKNPPAEEPPPEENTCPSLCEADYQACSGGAAPDTEIGAYCGELKAECLTTCQ